MRDTHAHILPGVDDGARNLSESLAMLAAAREVGVTSIVCTPHCRRPYFDYGAMHTAFELLREHAGGFPLAMGFEVNYDKLLELGIEASDLLRFEGSNELLLELPDGADAYAFRQCEHAIYELQARGCRVIIAHPERCHAIQEDWRRARDLVRSGCELQASADFLVGGRRGDAKRTAQQLFDERLYRHIASDAHRPEDYRLLARAMSLYTVRPAHLRT